MVIRDLTLRSAASFGSFHLIRLLYDEYMFYLVEHEVALATGETPIAVMGEVSVNLPQFIINPWVKISCTSFPNWLSRKKSNALLLNVYGMVNDPARELREMFYFTG